MLEGRDVMLGFNYMAWLALLVWVGVPLFAFLMGVLLWRRSRTPPGKILAIITGVAILCAPMLISNGVKAHYDQQVREMCAKDGGVRVYETVTLQAEKFNQWGQPNFNIPVTPYTKLKDSDQYYLEWEITNLKFGNPKLERSHFRLIRRSDQKLLGESVSYSRGGGDLPGPWNGSAFVCPEPTKHQGLEFSIFIKRDKP
jgi:hypothetical protein